jgi:hypothetical protein
MSRRDETRALHASRWPFQHVRRARLRVIEKCRHARRVRKMGRREGRFVIGPWGPFAHLSKRTQSCMLLLRLGLNSILGLFCQASFENEPKTRKAQIQGEIRAKKGPKFGFENEPERTRLWADSRGGRAQNQQTNPNEPEKRTRHPFWIQRDSGTSIRSFNRSCHDVVQIVYTFLAGSVPDFVPLF